MKKEKNCILAIFFLTLVIVLSVLNISNTINSIRPLVDSVLGTSKPGIAAKEQIRNAEDNYTENFNTKYLFINFHGAMRAAEGNRELNSVIKLNNGYLDYYYSAIDMTSRADSIAKLDYYLKTRDINLLYVAVPGKTDPDNEEMPWYIPDGTNTMQSDMVQKLNEAGVDTLDLRNDLKAHWDNWYEAFFYTDHHWKPETGFWAYTRVAEELNQRYGYELNEESMSLENYNVDIYEDYFLGSQGKKTGRFFCKYGLDDFAVIYPKFDTHMTMDVPVHDQHREGSFKDVIFLESNLEKDYFMINNYAAYIGGDYPLAIQNNSDAVNGEKILILKDSFTVSTQPYYSFMFKEVDVIDLRYYKDKSLKEYIEETNPDTVIILYSPRQLKNDNPFVFGLN